MTDKNIDSMIFEAEGGQIPPPEEFEKKDKSNYVSFFETAKYVFEQVRTEKQEDEDEEEAVFNKFLRFTKATGEITPVMNFVFRGKTYKPIDNEISRTDTVLLPTEATEYGDDDKLVKEISDFMFNYFEPPKYYESILPYLLLFYWVSDKFPFVPYLHFVGLTGTGKSTALETFGYVSYKGIKGSGAITIASIFRLAHEWKGTLLLDEFELGTKGGEMYNSLVQLLKAGVSDMPVFRTEGEGKKAVQLYQVKSPRVFSSQEPLQDAALQSRTIVVRMSKNTRKVPLYRMPQFYKEAQKLRNKLLMWRFRHITKIDLKDVEFGYDALKVFDGRVQQVLTPIYYLSCEDTRVKLIEFAKEQEEETKRERREEIDGQVFQYLYDHYKEDIKISDIAGFINTSREGKGFKSHFTERKIGNLVRKMLGYDTERRMDGYYVVMNDEKTEQLCTYYGMDMSVLADKIFRDNSSPAQVHEVHEVHETQENLLTDDDN